MKLLLGGAFITNEWRFICKHLPFYGSIKSLNEKITSSDWKCDEVDQKLYRKIQLRAEGIFYLLTRVCQKICIVLVKLDSTYLKLIN